MRYTEALRHLQEVDRFKRFEVIFKDRITGRKTSITLNAVSKNAVEVSLAAEDIISIKQVKVK
jgi:hypothetical protein